MLPLSVEALASFFELSRDGIQIWSHDGRLQYANPATYRMFGLPARAEVSCVADLLLFCVDRAGNALSPGACTLLGWADPAGPDSHRLLRVRTGAGRERWLRVQAYPQHGDPGREVAAGVISTSVDVTALVEEEQVLQRQAQYDALTGLPNRVLFDDRLRQALPATVRRGDTLAVCLMDLDGFKSINDTLGHKAGDRLLQEIAVRLEGAVRAGDTAARLGGDEFGLLLGGLRGPGPLEQALNRVLQDIARPVVIDGRSVEVTASIGITLFPGDVSDPEQLLRHADQAMYKAKDAGKGCFELYEPAVASKLHASRALLRKFQEALDGGQYRLFYQPKIDCRRGAVMGLEALVRWEHPVLGLRSPGEFLPLIEREDAIIHLGEWVIGAALAQLARWQEQGLALPVSVNIAARQFQRGNFGSRLGQLLDDQPLERLQLLGIEIAETAVLEDVNLVSGLLQRYRALGLRFELDDFGTGYSSLVHLKRLPVDVLKIDQSFVRDMLDDTGDLAIVQGVINLASAFHLGVVAEGVEDIEHVLTLLELGCDVMQGYCLARPMPAERVADWVRAFRPDPRWKLADDQFPPRSDFELLLATVLHRSWVQRVLSALAGAPDAAAWPEMSYEQCRLARWCAQAPERQLGGRDPARLDADHRELHRLGRLAQEEALAGRAVDPELVAKLSAAGEALVDALRALRRFGSG